MTHQSIVFGVWITIFALCFFRATTTATRSLVEGQGRTTQELDALIKHWESIGPIKFTSSKVLIPTTLFSLPNWTSDYLSGTLFHEILLYISYGAFFGMFAMPTTYSLNLECDRRFTSYLFRWVCAKLDVWIKTISVSAVLALVLLIPGLDAIGAFIRDLLLPVVPGTLGSEMFAAYASGLSVFFFFFSILYLTQLGMFRGQQVTYAIVTPYMWLFMQWYVNETLLPTNSVAQFAAFSLLAKIGIDFTADTTVFAVQRISHQYREK